jgi:uracil-DNA glycosylase family 4
MNRIVQLLDIRNDMAKAFPDEERRMVFGRGYAHAKLMLVGEAPGAQEDATGIPFVGAAGNLLEQLLWDAGCDPHDTYIANLLKWRPPNNRDPKPEEVEEQLPWLVRQVNVVKPQLIVALGTFATRNLLGTQARITDVHGQVFLRGFGPHGVTRNEYPEEEQWNVNVMPALHPAAALRQGRMKDMLRDDLKHAVLLLNGN